MEKDEAKVKSQVDDPYETVEEGLTSDTAITTEHEGGMHGRE